MQDFSFLAHTVLHSSLIESQTQPYLTCKTRRLVGRARAPTRSGLVLQQEQQHFTRYQRPESESPCIMKTLTRPTVCPSISLVDDRTGCRKHFKVE